MIYIWTIMERWAVRDIHIFWSAHQMNFMFAFVGEGPCWVQPYLSMLPHPQSMATLVEAFMQNKEVCKLIFATSAIRKCPNVIWTVSAFGVYRLFCCFLLNFYREEMDKADVHRSFSDPCHGVWHSILHQLYCNLLPCLQSHPIRHHGEFVICVVYTCLSQAIISQSQADFTTGINCWVENTVNSFHIICVILDN